MHFFESRNSHSLSISKPLPRSCSALLGIRMRSLVLFGVAGSALAFSPGALRPIPLRGVLKTVTRVASLDTSESTQELRVVIAGAGVGGLALANALQKHPHVRTTVLEKTSAFKRFGGPIQLASNAMQTLKELDEETYKLIEAKATFTGNLTNGIKDGERQLSGAKHGRSCTARTMVLIIIILNRCMV